MPKPKPNQAVDTPIEAILEDMGKRPPNGRPAARLPMYSLLKVLKGIEDQALEGRLPDPSYSRKILADYSCIILERAFLDYDNEIPLKVRADMALRIGPVIAMLETLIPKDTGSTLPKTEAALDQETLRRLNSIKSLSNQPISAAAQKTLDALAPAADQPPSEA